MFLLQYCAADVLSSLPITDWTGLDAAILRGEQVREPRYADTPPVPRPDNPRPGRGGSIYEQQTLLVRKQVSETQPK